MKSGLTSLTVVCVMVFSVFTSFAANEQSDEYVVPFNDGTKIYKNRIRQIGERYIFAVDRDDRLKVIEDDGKFILVSDKAGNEGWVASKFVKKIKIAKVYTFANEKIMAYLDNPTPVYILDSDNPEQNLKLDRSFAIELYDNLQRDHVERISGQIGYGERLVLLANEPDGGYLRY